MDALKKARRVFVHGGAATPHTLIQKLVDNASYFENLELIHLHLEGKIPYYDKRYAKNFRVANLFVGASTRSSLDYERVDYLPCFLSEIPQLFRSGRRPLDAALLQVSPPDRHGFCSLGVSVDVAKAASDVAPILIAQINHQMPHVHGDGFIHIDRFAEKCEVDQPLPELPSHAPTEGEIQIGKYVAGLVEDGSCLQMGIGSIPDAALRALKNHKNLGIHTEMMSDQAMKLIESGVVNNSKKKVHPGKTVSGFVLGSKSLYDYMDDNPSIIQLDIGYVNDPYTIARNSNVVAINSAVEVDLTGQVCADSVGSRIISGVGGQMDFIRGASLSKNGKPIIALTSQTKNGESRIVSALKNGAGVVTTRAHVHFIVTEYGVADLYGKTLNERAKSLIQIAHPADREDLEKSWASIKKSLSF